MVRERKPRFCEIYAIFFQCYFMSEIQVLMTVSDFFGFFSRNYFLEGGFTFQWGGISFSVEWGFIFKRRGAGLGELALVGGGIFKKYRRMDADRPPKTHPPTPHYNKCWYTCTNSFENTNIDIMERFVVMKCICDVDACKTPALLCYISNKLFGQQWLFEKVEESNTNDVETDNDSEE